MLVLALDTTTRAGSAALVVDGEIVEERSGDPRRTHAERLPHDLLTLLEARGRRTADVDVFAVASGPGSFTGLRVGIATLQGLSFVHRRPLLPVSSLEALARIAGRDAAAGRVIGAWMDAHRRDVFTALYRVGHGPASRLTPITEIEGPHVDDPTVTLERWHRLVGGETITFIGDGAVAWRDRIRASQPEASIDGHPALAGVIGQIASAMANAGAAGDPADVRPLYVRRPDAILERERQAFSGERTER